MKIKNMPTAELANACSSTSNTCSYLNTSLCASFLLVLPFQPNDSCQDGSTGTSISGLVPALVVLALVFVNIDNLTKPSSKRTRSTESPTTSSRNVMGPVEVGMLLTIGGKSNTNESWTLHITFPFCFTSHVPRSSTLVSVVQDEILYPNDPSQLASKRTNRIPRSRGAAAIPQVSMIYFDFGA